jgi:hypothetical protein
MLGDWRRGRHFVRSGNCTSAGREPEAASGDIVFRDGSRIVADLVHLELGVLKIRRPNGEEMDVEWPKVTSVTSPKPVVIVLRDGRRIESPLRPAAARESVFARSGEDGDELTVPLRLISEINPPEGMLKIKGNLSLAASVSDGNTRTRSLASWARSRRAGIAIGSPWAASTATPTTAAT